MGASYSVMKNYISGFGKDTVLDIPEGYFPYRIKIKCNKNDLNVNISYDRGMWIVKRVFKNSDANSYIFDGDIIYNIGRRSIYSYTSINRINQILKIELKNNNYKFIEFIIFRKFKYEVDTSIVEDDWISIKK